MNEAPPRPVNRRGIAKRGQSRARAVLMFGPDVRARGARLKLPGVQPRLLWVGMDETTKLS